MITFLSLMTAVFWGQLSGCSPGFYDIKRYSCTNRSAYGATCAFATLLFLLQARIHIVCIHVSWSSRP